MDKLLAIKAYLYAILAALLIVVGVVIYATISAPKPATQAFICGNADLEPSTPRYTSGKALFAMNCASCHAKNMRNNLTGPALGPAVEHWSKYPASDLYAYIRDSQGMLKKRHARAVAIWKEYQPTLMPSFSTLTDADMADLLEYIKTQHNR